MSKVFEARFEFDKNKAAQIAARLHEQFYGGKEFFAGYQIPEYIPPRNLVPGSKETGNEKGTFTIQFDTQGKILKWTSTTT